MLKYAAIIPHSPLLSTTITKKHSLPPKTNASFDAVAEKLKEHDIRHIVTIGSHPKFERSSFSTYISDEYEIAFPEFGDLITSVPVKPWFNAIHKARETIVTPPLEILSHSQLDYTHGIPLMHLSERFQNKLLVFPINTLSENDQISIESMERLGRQLRSSLDRLGVPYAVICSGDLYVTMEQTHSRAVHQENKKIKLALEKSLQYPQSTELDRITAIKPPTLSHTLPVLRGILNETSPTKSHEISFETVYQTSFYFAEVDFSHV